MDSILQSIEDWFRGLLVSGIMDHLTSTFDSVNDKVGEISTNVGMSPAGFSPAVYDMIENISENVIMPIAGIYVVYLFNKDKKVLYLTLERSITEANKKVEEKEYSGREKTKKGF